MFLMVTWRIIVDTPTVPARDAVPEIVAVPAVFEADGVTLITPAVTGVAAVAAVAEVPAVTHLEIRTAQLERDAETVARNLHNNPDMDYFDLDINDNRTTVVAHKVRLKSGARAVAPAREIAVAEANGVDIGSAEVSA